MKKRFTITLALLMAVVGFMQVFVIGISAVCTHDWEPFGDTFPSNYSYIDDNSHSCSIYKNVYCKICGAIDTICLATFPEGHDITSEEVWYYNELCIRTYCSKCGHQFSIGPVNP